MKKILHVTLCLALAIALIACGNIQNAPSPTTSPTPIITPDPTFDPTPDPTPTPIPTVKPTPTPEKDSQIYDNDSTSVSDAQEANVSQTTVYITNTGKKYHLGGCRYLSKSKIPISLSDAKARGYDPCSVCGPPY
jgi:hypothetical protein